MIRTTLRAQAAALVAAFLLWASPAWSQAVLQGGPVSALGGHVPTYLPSGQGGLATVMDSGGAGGGPIGFGLSEKGLQARTPPGQGTGPLGMHDCDWDTYATNPAGANFLCFDPDVGGSGLIASSLPLNFSIGGKVYPFPTGTGLPVANILTVTKSGADANNNCANPANPCGSISHAIVEAYSSFDAGNANIQINVGPGTWAEDILVNGRLRGSGTSVPVPSGCNITTCPDGQLIINGAGAGSTTIAGSGNFCGTVIASDGAVVGLENATWTGTAASCQSILFAQIGGTINLYGGNIWGSARVGMWHCENAGSSIQVWADQTYVGTAQYWITAGANATLIWSQGHAIFNGAAFGTLIFISSSATVQFFPANIFAGTGATASDTFQAKSNSVIEFDNAQSPMWPGGTYGYLESGAQFVNFSNPSVVAPCIAGNVGCPALNPVPTGLGTGGTISVAQNSTPYAGQIDMLTGTGALGTGSFYLSFPAATLLLFPGTTGYCTFSLTIGGNVVGVWTEYAFVRGALASLGPPSRVPIVWVNGLAGSPLLPQNLSDNSDYLINYTCNN